MKRLIALAMVITMGLSVFAGCKSKQPENKPATENDKSTVTEETDYKSESKPSAKVAVNISGTVEEISDDGSKILVDGKWIIITEDTRFEDDPDNGVQPVSNDFKVGNMIAGWTSGDPEADEVIADAIYSNYEVVVQE